MYFYLHKNRRLYNSIICRMNAYSLYIDHQALAPLIHSLQDTLALCQTNQPHPCHKSQLRLPIYQEFISILHTLYNSHFAQIKLQHLEPKLEEPILTDYERKEIEVGGVGQERWEGENQGKRQRGIGRRVRTRATRSLQIEIELVQWMISQDKNIFDKREIVEKHAQISGSSKRQLSLSKIMTLLQKYKLKNVIIRGKNGEQHFLRYDAETDVSTVVKREEFSKEISRFMHNEEGFANEAAWGQLADPIQEHQQESQTPCQTPLDLRGQEQLQGAECQKEK